MHASLVVCFTLALLAIGGSPAHAAFGFLREFGSENVSQSDPNYLFNPNGITVSDTPRTVYVSSQTGRITSFSPDGSGAQVVLSEASPHIGAGDGIAAGGGRLYVADTTNSRVVVLSTSGALVAMWGWGVADGSNAFQTCTSNCQPGIPGSGEGQLNYPGGIAVDADSGRVYVADDRNHRIAQFDIFGRFVRNIGRNNGDGTRGTGNGEFTNPTGVAINDEFLFVSEQGSVSWSGGHRVQKLTLDGAYVTKWGSLGSGDGQFNFPDDIALDVLGNSWVIEPAPNARVQVFDPSGTFLGKIHETGERYFSGHGVTFDSQGNLYILDSEGGRVLVYGEEDEPGCPPRAAASAVNEVRVVRLKPGAEFKRAGCRHWSVLREGTVLKEGDELNVDPDGEVTLEFGDNSKVTVQETTQLKIKSFFTEGGIVRTELLLKVGQVAAKVNKTETTRSDFRIKSPTFAASVRGTDFSVFYDPGTKSGLTSVREGRVSVKGKLVSAGHEVEVTPRGVGPVARLGRAGAPKGGVNRVAAMEKVNRLLARADESCGFEVKTYKLTRTRKGWDVLVRLIGRTRGKARFEVLGRRASASNKLARRVVRRCA